MADTASTRTGTSLARSATALECRILRNPGMTVDPLCRDLVDRLTETMKPARWLRLIEEDRRRKRLQNRVVMSVSQPGEAVTSCVSSVLS